MKLSAEQLASYRAEGYLLVPDCFSADEVELMTAQLPEVYAHDTPARVLEHGTDEVRMIHGGHKSNDVFGRVVRDPRILRPARQLLDDDVYVHQFKVNAKRALVGDLWAWHQDFTFWHHKDGMPTARAVNAAIFLDAVTEFNGPLTLIPRTHRLGTPDDDSRPVALSDDSPRWTAHLTVELEYSLRAETVERYASEYGIVAPTGAAGAVLLFSPSLFHGSSANMSPHDRTMLLVSYNSVTNHLVDVDEPRPWFLAERDFTPVEEFPLSSDGIG